MFRRKKPCFYIEPKKLSINFVKNMHILSFQICPYLRNFKVMVIDDLSKLASVLHNNSHITLDKFTLVYSENQQSATGLSNFLPQCGQRINVLGLECSTQTFLTFEDLTLIATHCPLIDGKLLLLFLRQFCILCTL